MAEFAWAALLGAAWILMLYGSARLLPMRVEEERFELASTFDPDTLARLLSDSFVDAWLAAPLALEDVPLRRVDRDGIEYRASRYRAARVFMDHVMVEVERIDMARRHFIGLGRGPHLQLRATIEVRPDGDVGSTMTYVSQRRRRLGVIAAGPEGAVEAGWRRALGHLERVPSPESMRAIMRRRKLRGIIEHRLTIVAAAVGVALLGSETSWRHGVAYALGALVVHELAWRVGAARRFVQARADVESLRVPAIT